MAKRQSPDVLRYSATGCSQATVRLHYRAWREAHGLRDQCDNERCRFHTEQLVWNQEPLTLILDHVDGNRLDNRPEKLRLLCPNCDSQLGTGGGANRGRVQDVAEDRFSVVRKDGGKDYALFLDGSLTFNDQRTQRAKGSGKGKRGGGPTTG